MINGIIKKISKRRKSAIRQARMCCSGVTSSGRVYVKEGDYNIAEALAISTNNFY